MNEYDSIKDHLGAVNWDVITATAYLNDAHDNFISLIHDTLDKFVPLKLSESATYLPWFNSELINLTNKTKRLHQKYKKRVHLLLNAILNFAGRNVSAPQIYAISNIPYHLCKIHNI